MTRQASRNPWTFVPTLYFAEGLPYILVNAVSVILYKRLGLDNASITFWTSFLYFPWVFKMLWGPLVDTRSTKRTWILGTQAVLGFCLVGIAFVLHVPGFFLLSLGFLLLIAFVSATHDIAADGFYMLALTPSDQSLFVGIRATCYRFAMIFGTGFLVWLAGWWEARWMNIALSWSMVFALAGVLLVGISLFHKFMLPYPPADGTADATEQGGEPSFVGAFASYFQQERISAILAFILFYRLGEAFLVKLASPFLLDSRKAGGLALTTSQVGIVYGTTGLGALLLGGILGGIVLKKFGLKRWLWPMALIVNLPMFVYILLAYTQPPVIVAGLLVFLEQFSYGFGYAAYMVYLMFVARGRYKTSHFAISTGIMALGMMLPGFVSGALQEMLGYRQFFVMTAFAAIPGIATLFFIPIPDEGIQ